MPTEKGMFVLDTDASVVAISGILHQEQEWNGRTVLRPIAYGSKVLSDFEMKHGAPKVEMFAVITFVEKNRAYLGSAPFKLRVDNRALAWLKTYSMDQNFIGRWIVRLDGYHIIIEHRTRDKHQNADSLSKKTEFYERLKEKQANKAEINSSSGDETMSGESGTFAPVQDDLFGESDTFEPVQNDLSGKSDSK